ncbi:MAG TPA: sigma-70 family RNA polymerase sigma factor [Pyrinomonadaceae bacterium]|nr:sigma-70 family RNA polymerase sigma factor [Pyrinomonadaceae bacterium]
MSDVPQTTTQEDADFRELLKQLLSEEQSRDELLINPVFQYRLKLICQSITRNATDADVLANYVRAVVCDRLDQFEPDYNRPYGNFFNWVKRIARNKFIDDYRRKSVRKEDGQLDETYVVEDVTVDIEAEAERREALGRFWAFVGKFDELTQKIMHYHFEDNSLREIQDKLAENGIKLSHVAIGSLVKKVVADFFASEDARIATIITRKGDQESRGRERGGPPSARKTGS